ncbi:MAG: thiosulfate oxidation carrier protein SoxY, partial [Kiloniellales bacterium]
LLRAAGLVGIALAAPRALRAADPEMELATRIFGRAPVRSDRLRLVMPPVFANGYTVPLDLEVESPMTVADHVRSIRVFAPKNPLIEVAGFRFTPQSGRARVSTRIRLAAPQHVVAVAETSDDALLLSTAWVEVSSNGCA